MIDRAFIGYRAPRASIELERGQLRLFAKATGEPNPIYFDEDAARSAGFRTLPAPPTFAFCLKQLAGQPYSYLREMGVDIGRLLHGEQTFEYGETIFAGDKITVETTILDIASKKGGAFDVITAQTDALNDAGRCCVRQRTILIVRYGEVSW